MKITGYRTLASRHHWQRAVGDVNGHIEDAVTEVPILIIETDEGVEGVGIGSHADIGRLFPAIVGEDPRAVSSLFDRMLAAVFKSGHSGATYGGLATIDSALWIVAVAVCPGGDHGSGQLNTRPLPEIAPPFEPPVLT